MIPGGIQFSKSSFADFLISLQQISQIYYPFTVFSVSSVFMTMGA